MTALLHRLLSRARPRLTSQRPVFTSEQGQYSQFDVGVGTYGKPRVIYWDCGAKLRIGRYCSIAGGVTILLGGEHHTDWVTTYPFSLLYPAAAALPGYPLSKGDVTVGSDVWLGQDALVLSGVTIGHGAVIGARSVVARDVEPYAVVAGNPARLIRSRFEPALVARLLRVAWWDWPADRVRGAWPLLMSPDVERFLSEYE